MASERRTAIAAFLLAFVVYNANLRYIGAYDSLSTALLPFRILAGHGLTLADPSPMPEGIRYSIVRGRDGTWRSFYPVATAVVVTPLYVPAAALIATRVETDVEYLRLVMDKLAASVLAALSAAVLCLVLLRLVSRGPALALAAAWAFGTGTWTISSQALWQTGASGLFVALALLLVVRRDDSPYAPLALGVCAGLLAANRPTDAVFTLAFLAIALRVWGRRGALAFVPVFLLGAATLGYNLRGFGHALGAYGTFRGPDGQALGMSSAGLSGLVGLLFSNRGLLPWCPFLAVAAIGLFRRGAQRLPGAALLAAAFAASLALHGRHYDWLGGYCYGPRFALHGLGALVAALACPLERIWKHAAARVLFAASVLFSIGLQAVGAFCYPGNDSGRERDPWDFDAASPVRAWQAGPGPTNFLNLLLPGRASGSPLEPAGARAGYDWEATPPPAWPPDSVRTLKVRVTNLGGLRWSSVGGRLGRGAVLWNVRWSRPAPEGTALAEEWRWAFFGLDPGAVSSRVMTVASPPFEGPVVLEVGLRQLAGPGFDELGVPPLRAAVTLRPGSQ